MKALYDRDGVADLQEVEILAWDRNKYFLFKNSDGEIEEDKTWKFQIKRSNKIHNLSFIDYNNNGVLFGKPLTNKEAAEEIKKGQKRSIKFIVHLSDNPMVEFGRLDKALKFASGTVGITHISVIWYNKRSSSSFSIVEFDEGLWRYYALDKEDRVSEKTIKNWVERQSNK